MKKTLRRIVSWFSCLGKKTGKEKEVWSEEEEHALTMEAMRSLGEDPSTHQRAVNELAAYLKRTNPSRIEGSFLSENSDGSYHLTLMPIKRASIRKHGRDNWERKALETTDDDVKKLISDR